MWTKWLPWRFILSRVARSQGFLDPIPLLSKLRRLAQPSEVDEPIELLRAGVIFHARGLINAKVIQYNLDWVWPYWAERQYDPEDPAFVPRAFSITHINLTHRNWTAVGVPDVDRLPVVDPRGLVTPLFDSWSLDAWLLPDRGEPLLPSRAESVEQRLRFDEEAGVAVETRTRGEAGVLVELVDAVWEEGEPLCRIRIRVEAEREGRLAVALRPANPEGVSFIHEASREGPDRIRVNDEVDLRLSPVPDGVRMSSYAEGDVFLRLREREEPGEAPGEGPSTEDGGECDVGLLTAAALFRVEPGRPREVAVRIPLEAGSEAEPARTASAPRITRPPRRAAAASDPGGPAGDGGGPPGERTGAGEGRASAVRPSGDDRRTGARAWSRALEGTCRMEVPGDRYRFLFDAAVRSLVLHSPGDVYPGPYTYKRFWFRDAAFIVDALLATGLVDRARRTVARFPDRQDRSGYFRSQEGEWDSNGAALRAMERYRRLSGEELPREWVAAARKGGEWIGRKRLPGDLDEVHAGLLPAGFSAEHLGPNDYYYWDDFWCAAGLRASASIVRAAGDGETADGFEREARDLLGAVDRSLERSAGRRSRPGVPASPYRRMDAGAVGSVAAGYPLRLWSPEDPRLLETVDYLLREQTVDGGFFQEMIHSGINAYLTLHLAQVLLRAGDPRQEELVETVAALASPTGQWPEAIHPGTGGGCMGDGQHIWAASEWVLMMRSWFIREEGDRLVLASGIPRRWLESGAGLRFGPTPTRRGPVSVRVRGTADGAEVAWEADWRGEPPALEVRVPGHRRKRVEAARERVVVVPEGGAAGKRTGSVEATR